MSRRLITVVLLAGGAWLALTGGTASATAGAAACQSRVAYETMAAPGAGGDCGSTGKLLGAIAGAAAAVGAGIRAGARGIGRWVKGDRPRSIEPPGKPSRSRRGPARTGGPRKPVIDLQPRPSSQGSRLDAYRSGGGLTGNLIRTPVGQPAPQAHATQSVAGPVPYAPPPAPDGNNPLFAIGVILDLGIKAARIHGPIVIDWIRRIPWR